MVQPVVHPLRRVFLSHSSKDKPFIDRLALDLERVGVGVWYDKWEIRVGDSLISKISSGIEENDYLAIALSPNSVESEWVQREVNAALMRELEEKKVIVLPLLLQDCKVPVLLREKIWADFRSSYEQGLDELLCSVSPESPQSIQRSKDFRTAQYLITGLAATDDRGNNTLTASQFRRIYPYRKQLGGYLGPEEKRLLFWSAVAFKAANPLTPPYTAITTPVWGLHSDVSLSAKAQWVLDGLTGPLFEHMLPFYSWATNLVGPNVRALKNGSILRNSDGDLFIDREPLPIEKLGMFIHLLAQENDAMFEDIFLPNLSENMGNRSAPLIIESAGQLSPPPDESFFTSFQSAEEPIAVAAALGLSVKQPMAAVDLVKSILRGGHTLSHLSLDRIFSRFGRREFVEGLRAWLPGEKRTDVRARIAIALVNAGAFDESLLQQVASEVEADQLRPQFLPMVVRAFGHIDAHPDHILKWLNPADPVVCEAAVFSFARLLGTDSSDRLLTLLGCQSATVEAAVIEALAKAGGLTTSTLRQILRTSASPLVLSSAFGAVATLKPADWRELLRLPSEAPPLLRLCAARAFVQIGERDELVATLDEVNTDEVLRFTADEFLFAKGPFEPPWIKDVGEFNEELARAPVRLTTLDKEYVWMATHYDLDRTVAIVMKAAGLS